MINKGFFFIFSLKKFFDELSISYLINYYHKSRFIFFSTIKYLLSELDIERYIHDT